MIRTILVTIGFIVGWSFAVRSAIYAACFYLWIAYFRPESWVWGDFFASLPLSLMAGVFLIFKALLSPASFRIDRRNGLPILFLAFSLLSSLLAPNFEYSLTYLEDFAKAVIVSYLLSVLITKEAEYRLVITVIALSLGFEAAKQGWGQLVLNPGAQNSNPVPFLGDNNLVAVGMAMLLPTLGALVATSTGLWRRGFQFLSIGILYRAISTYSRGGLLAISALGALYWWRSPNKLRTLLAFAVAVAIVVPVLPQAYWNRMSTIGASEEDRDSSQTGRLHFWEVAITMANDRPLVGVGHRGYELNYNRYDFSSGLYGTGRAVHSSWFAVLAELGYPGLLLFVTIIATSWLSCRSVRLAARRGEVSEALGRYAIALEAALVAFIIGGSFVSFQYNEMLWHFFALSAALERVGAAEAAANRIGAQQLPLAAKAAEPAPEFEWA